MKKVSTRVFLIEDTLFFGDRQYPLQFHKQKLTFHRASMDAYQKLLISKGWSVERIVYDGPDSVLDSLCVNLREQGVSRVFTSELNDFALRQRVLKATSSNGLEFVESAGPGFINSVEENREYRASKKRWYMADFYQWQRKRLGILLDDGKPMGGQWSFDEENRKKLPKKQLADLPSIPQVRRTTNIESCIASVEAQFSTNPGSLDHWLYPTSHGGARRWLERFLCERFEQFGPYEDAIVAKQNWLYHSVLTPMLNIGLLTPEQVVSDALDAAKSNNTPINSVEGFVRQIIGWREFMRATYGDLGVEMRTGNHWNHTRAMPESFYTANTGIDPVDDVIRRVLSTGYCHHIERLMVLGGFMFLCEIHPDAIYQWFMELFIDSYDWVMVPNVYAMSQHADGGAITTKPYFSGSNYIVKMSHYPKGEWSEIWDALFWRWIAMNQAKLKGNPRWAMMVKNVQRMDAGRLEAHKSRARDYLDSL